jgi:hypothetical protein
VSVVRSALPRSRALVPLFPPRFTRISLALGTSRLFPPRHIAHRIGLASAIIFACFSIALLTAVIVECAPASSWGPPPGMPKEKVMCFIPKSSVYYSVSGAPLPFQTFSAPDRGPTTFTAFPVGLLADVVLTAIPVWLLWRLKTSRSYRRLLLPGLCAGIVITMPTVALIVFQALPPSWEPMKSETRLRINFVEVNRHHFVAIILGADASTHTPQGSNFSYHVQPRRRRHLCIASPLWIVNGKRRTASSDGVPLLDIDTSAWAVERQFALNHLLHRYFRTRRVLMGRRLELLRPRYHGAIDFSIAKSKPQVSSFSPISLISGRRFR